MKTDDIIVAIIVFIIASFATLLYLADPADGSTPVCEDGYTYVEAVDICAANDYYMEDGIRMPLGMGDIKVLLVEEGARLPTKEEVDAIHAAATIKLRPRPFTRYNIMTRMSEFRRHDEYINNQLEEYGAVGGELVAGHKKDVIAMRRNGRVTIYGWHYPNGTPIQPVYSGHGFNYRDYSHGVRLIKTPRR